MFSYIILSCVKGILCVPARDTSWEVRIEILYVPAKCDTYLATKICLLVTTELNLKTDIAVFFSFPL